MDFDERAQQSNPPPVSEYFEGPSKLCAHAHLVADIAAFLVLCTLTGISLAYVVLDAQSGAVVSGIL